MAIDTAVKRKSAVAIGQRHVGPVVVPSGTIDQTPRQVIAYSYAGIRTLGGLAPASRTHIVKAETRTYIVPAESRIHTVKADD